MYLSPIFTSLLPSLPLPRITLYGNSIEIRKSSVRSKWKNSWRKMKRSSLWRWHKNVQVITWATAMCNKITIMLSLYVDIQNNDDIWKTADHVQGRKTERSSFDSILNRIYLRAKSNYKARLTRQLGIDNRCRVHLGDCENESESRCNESAKLFLCAVTSLFMGWLVCIHQNIEWI